MRPSLNVLATILLVIASPSIAAPVDEFHAVMVDEWAAFLKSNPQLATALGRICRP